MNQTLKDKIKQLYASGFRSVEQIKAQLIEKNKIVEQVEESRPSYAYEAELYHLLIPNIVTIQEFAPLDKRQRLDLVQTRLLSMFAAADASQKANVLALSMRVTALNDRIESSGSAGFGDPNFLQPTHSVVSISYGTSWLEENELSEPTDEEIRTAILS